MGIINLMKMSKENANGDKSFSEQEESERRREQMLIHLLINKRQNNFSENYLRKCENVCVCVLTLHIILFVKHV